MTAATEWTRDRPTQPGLYWIFSLGLWPSIHLTEIVPNKTPLFGADLCWMFYHPVFGEVLASIDEVMSIREIRKWMGPVPIDRPDPPEGYDAGD